MIRLPTQGYRCILRWRVTLLIAAFVAISAMSCEPAPPIILASLTEVKPSVLEPGDMLILKGDGFVEGSASVTLSGNFDPHGMVYAVEKNVQLQGTAIDEETVEIPITSMVMEQLASEPLIFKGTVRVVFPQIHSLGSTQIEASNQHISIELRPFGGGVEIAAKHERESESLFGQLGLKLVDSEQKSDVIIAAVAIGSAADKAGISAGDRLLAVDRVALATPSDLAGLDLEKSHYFEFVSAAGNVQTADIKLTTEGLLKMDEFVSMLFMAFALGLFWVFAAPKKKLMRRDFSSVGSLSFARFFAVGASAVCLLFFPAISIVSRADVGFTLILLGLFIICLLISILYSKGPLRTRMMGLVVHMIPAPLIVVTAGVLNSAFGLWNIVAVQASPLWGWNVWSNPFSLIAFIFAISLLWPSPFVDKKQFGIAHAATLGTAIVGAIVLTTFGLGGWSIPGVHVELMISNPILLLAGAFVFAFKASLVLASAYRLALFPSDDRRSRRGGSSRIVIRVAALLLSTTLAFIWRWSELPNDILSASQILSSGIFIVICTVFVASEIRDLLMVSKKKRLAEKLA